MSTDLAICQTALILVNATPITSFSDSTREAAMCNALYETTKNEQLQSFRWSFSTFQEALAQTTETPLFDWNYEYQLPTGVLRVLKTDLLGNNYRIMKDKLYSNETAVELLYQKDPGEEFFPAYFVRLLEYKLAEDLSLALVQDENMATAFARKYQQQLIKARGIDSQNTPNLAVPANELSLTAVRGTDG